MIRYEVTLKIEKNIRKSFETWLEPHVQEMLTFDGFIKATIHKEISEDNDISILIVNYKVSSIDNLKYYFNNNADKMRQDGLSKFPKGFTATRRIFDGDIEINL